MKDAACHRRFKPSSATSTSRTSAEVQALFANGSRMVKCWAVRKGLSPAQAEDLAQNASLKLWKKFHKSAEQLSKLMDADGQPSGLWFKAAQWAYVDLLRTARRHRHRDEAGAKAYEKRAASDAPQLETAIDVQKLLSKPDAIYAVPELFGESNESLARKTGLSAAGIRKRGERFRRRHLPR